MPGPVMNNLATSKISEGRNAPTGSKQQISRNLGVSNTFKFQISGFCKHNFSGNSRLCVEKRYQICVSYYIMNICQQHVWWRRLLILILRSGIVLKYLDLKNEFRSGTSMCVFCK